MTNLSAAPVKLLPDRRHQHGPHRRRLLTPAAPVHPLRSSATHVCNCGHCARCLDDARWEKIYNEKFADPFYYAPLQLKQRSTLVELL